MAVAFAPDGLELKCRVADAVFLKTVFEVVLYGLHIFETVDYHVCSEGVFGGADSPNMDMVR